MNKTVAFLLTVLLSSAAGAKDYVITDFGAVSDTTVLSTEAIQQAIDRCSEAGGGRVVVPAGMYMTGTPLFCPRGGYKCWQACPHRT